MAYSKRYVVRRCSWSSWWEVIDVSFDVVKVKYATRALARVAARRLNEDFYEIRQAYVNERRGNTTAVIRRKR